MVQYEHTKKFWKNIEKLARVVSKILDLKSNSVENQSPLEEITFKIDYEHLNPKIKHDISKKNK